MDLTDDDNGLVLGARGGLAAAEMEKMPVEYEQNQNLSSEHQ